MKEPVQTPKRTSYWLLVRSRHEGIEVLVTRLPNGRQALPAFSFEEEAEMFLCLQDLRDGWRVRETATGELLSMLYSVLQDIGYVTLDPIPENAGLDTLGLLSIPRKDFVVRLERTSGRSGAVENDVRAFWPLTADGSCRG